MRCVLRSDDLTACLYMYVVRNTEFLGHWLSEVNTIEIKKISNTISLHQQTFQFQIKYFNETSKY